MNQGARNHREVPTQNSTEISSPSRVSPGGPEIPDLYRDKWQKIVDLTAGILNVSVTMINHWTSDGIEIIACGGSNTIFSNTTGKKKFNTESIKEVASGNNVLLAVTDMQQSEYWKNHPLARMGFNAYFGVPIVGENSNIFGSFCILNDTVTEFSTITNDLLLQFKAIIENDIQCIILQTRLEQRLSRQEMIIREANHRINNHLTLLISYIQLQAVEKRNDQSIKDIFLDIQNRIKSISVIHEVLCTTSINRTHPPLDEYLIKLCNSLISNVTGLTINCTYEIERLELPIELSVSIGLVISELVTNSIKYAFTGTLPPAINIAIRRTQINRLVIEYKDNGIGLPSNFDINQSDTIGMSLIKLQIEQLNGEMQVLGDSGAEFRIVIDG